MLQQVSDVPSREKASDFGGAKDGGYGSNMSIGKNQFVKSNFS